MTPRLSVVVITAREDYPYLDRPQLHCLAPSSLTLACQSMTDIELVVVDLLWSRRPAYFADHRLPYPVKHVPPRPNPWHLMGRPAIATQFNTGLAWADGELIFTAGEATMYHPRFCELVWQAYAERDTLVSAWYIAEHPAPSKRFLSSAGLMPDSHWALRGAPSPREYCLLGYDGREVNVEHRYNLLGKDELTPLAWQNYWAYSAISQTLAERLNGYNELLDGSIRLIDCDAGSRLDHAGARLALHRDAFVVEPPARAGWHPSIQRIEDRNHWQCNYAVLLYYRARGLVRANCLPPEDFSAEEVALRSCASRCEVPVEERCYCARMFPRQPRDWEMQSRIAHWPDFDLRAERQRRLRREPPYDQASVYP